ncbi:unnamed protein product [Dicrocoelium dendriticum]|nr:unnamed protein product [Dicrocoelium dendriticum]
MERSRSQWGLYFLRSAYRWGLPLVRRLSITRPTCTNLYFTEKHEWIRVDDKAKMGTVGLSKYAEQKLGDVVYVELPGIKDAVTANEQCGLVESVKAVSEVYSPASGTVVDVNEALNTQASLINKSPMDDGWLFKMELSDPSELQNLMDQKKYDAYLVAEE